MATIYKTDNTIEHIQVTDFSVIQEAIGGYVEVVGHDENGNHILVNEDGLRLGLPKNPRFPWLVGNVVVATNDELN
jgi:hypothetical protein